MKCPHCDGLLCAECGSALNTWNTFQRGCDDHNGQLCNECGFYIVEDQDCMDCVQSAKEDEYEDSH
jgi:hypothetical protein